LAILKTSPQSTPRHKRLSTAIFLVFFILDY
jgi:hypothetical protein